MQLGYFFSELRIVWHNTARRLRETPQAAGNFFK